MIFHQIRAGGDRNFSYLAGDAEGGSGVVFDPPMDPSLFIEPANRDSLDLVYIIITHGHSDHSLGLREAKRNTKAKLITHVNSHLNPDLPVRDGNTVPLGSLEMRFIHTPGHTDDSICILLGNKLVTGDTLFVGKVGGTDYGEGAREEWDSLRNKILTLEDHIEVYPGHDYGVKPFSTIGHEKKTNPFVLRKTFEDFLELKKNWLQYKRDHGIA